VTTGSDAAQEILTSCRIGSLARESAGHATALESGVRVRPATSTWPLAIWPWNESLPDKFGGVSPNPGGDIGFIGAREAVGRLVEHDDLGIAQQGGGDPLTMAYPERVRGHMIVGSLS